MSTRKGIIRPGATTDSSIVEELQDAVERLLCKGLTCELLKQFREAVFLYKECLKKLKHLYLKINDLLKKQAQTQNLMDGLKFLHYLYDVLKERTEALNEYKDSFSAKFQDRAIHDLNTVPRMIGSIHLTYYDAPVQRRRTVTSKTGTYKAKPVDSDEFEKTMASHRSGPKATLQKRQVGILEELTKSGGNFEFITSGNVTEIINLANVDAFNIDNGSPNLCDLDTTVKLFSFEESNATSRTFTKHYLTVGTWLTPLIPHITPVLWDSNLYLLPDYSSFSRSM